jgi:hypothetical protein
MTAGCVLECIRNKIILRALVDVEQVQLHVDDDDAPVKQQKQVRAVQCEYRWGEDVRGGVVPPASKLTDRFKHCAESQITLPIMIHGGCYTS